MSRVDGVEMPPEIRGEVADFISQHLLSSAREREDIWYAMYVQSEAKRRYVEFGLKRALASCEYGGTTAQYEAVLQRVLDATGYWDGDPVLEFYRDQVNANELPKPHDVHYVHEQGWA
jgi:hypothetical protein